MRTLCAAAVLLSVCSTATAQDSWATKAPMPNPREGHASAGLGGFLYVLGGASTRTGGGYVHVNHRYDPVTDAWATRTPITDYDGTGALTGIGWEQPAVAAANGRIYQLCGAMRWNGGYYPDNYVYEYDPAGDAWSRLPSAPFTGPAWAVELDGKIWLAYNPTGAVGLVQFDPVTRGYSAKPNLSGERQGFYLGALDGKIYIAGGDDYAGSFRDTLHEFDPATDAWSTKSARMPAGNAYGAFASAKARFFTFGGWDNLTNARTYAYRPATDAWETLAPMPYPAYWSAAGVVRSQGTTKVHVTGGDDDTRMFDGHLVYTPPALPKPSDPSGLFMRTPDGDDLPHGSFSGMRIELGASVDDPNGFLPVTLEVEVVPDGAAFTGQPNYAQVSTAAEPASVTVDLPSGSYKWRARCQNSNEEYNPAGWIDFGSSDPDFTVDGAPPTAPTAVGPVNTILRTNRLYEPTAVEFAWIEATDASPDPLTYLIQVSSSPTFAVVDRAGTATGSTGAVYVSWSTAPLYWRVQATDAFGNVGPWSSVSSFELVYHDGVDNGAGDARCSASAASGSGGLALTAALLAIAGLFRRPGRR